MYSIHGYELVWALSINWIEGAIALEFTAWIQGIFAAATISRIVAVYSINAGMNEGRIKGVLSNWLTYDCYDKPSCKNVKLNPKEQPTYNFIVFYIVKERLQLFRMTQDF